MIHAIYVTPRICHTEYMEASLTKDALVGLFWRFSRSLLTQVSLTLTLASTPTLYCVCVCLCVCLCVCIYCEWVLTLGVLFPSPPLILSALAPLPFLHSHSTYNLCPYLQATRLHPRRCTLTQHCWVLVSAVWWSFRRYANARVRMRLCMWKLCVRACEHVCACALQPLLSWLGQTWDWASRHLKPLVKRPMRPRSSSSFSRWVDELHIGAWRETEISLGGDGGRARGQVGKQDGEFL